MTIRRCSFLSGLWEYTLSPQQRDICQLLAQGLNQKKIAEALGISHETVKVQIFRIKHKQNGVGVNKNDTKQPSQYPSTLFETSVDTPEESEISNLIKELEASKGLSLTTLQKDIILMRSRERGVKAIAESFSDVSKIQ
jgi:biotin operon repressor